MNRKRVLTFAVCAMFYAVSAAAEPTAKATQGDELEQRFRQADRDGDGKLSPAEARQAAWFVDEVRRFDSVDRDHSGTVTLVEIGEAIAAQVAGWLDADSDKDGRVSASEAKGRSGLTDSFTRADADSNGIVTREEIERLSQRSYYRDAELPSVAPNIIEKRF